MRPDEMLLEMRKSQMEFGNRIKDERNVGYAEMDNIKAIRHELIELEHAFHWKWWTNESDFERKDEFDDYDREEYIREELIDIFHFVLQEMVMHDEAQIRSGRIVGQLTSGSPRKEDYFKGEGGITSIKKLRNLLSKYEEDRRSRQEWCEFVNTLGRFFDFYFEDVEDIYDQYRDKNEENHARQDGESRDGYEAGESVEKVAEGKSTHLKTPDEDPR